MPKSKDAPVKKHNDDSDSDGDVADDEGYESEDAEPKVEFRLGHTTKLAGFIFLMFILLSSDVFISRVMGRSGVDLVAGQYPTKKGIMVQGLLLSMAVIVFEFLICKEKL
jgi:hypothetical protein